jgi:hypothetical protein
VQGGEDHGEQREKFVVDLLLTLAKRLAQMGWRKAAQQDSGFVRGQC